MVVGGSQQETLDPGFGLLGNSHQLNFGVHQSAFVWNGGCWFTQFVKLGDLGNIQNSCIHLISSGYSLYTIVNSNDRRGFYN
ncbi:unnamed protein product [Schistosoma margrebowiei]|uniref:Uncharacterized protein n=1 Tax=Schistosoma margrebowiei TaxID=48269 RepID=A0A183MS67_9TREM|nr:unnamed protein product [Schistosoma margrebowiei]